ncbi:MAG: hypothetical protein ABI551_18450 [Polyangiaceae bacterium]
MTNEAVGKQGSKDEEYAKKVRAARIRAAVAFVFTLAAVSLLYKCSVTDGGLPVASCKSDRECEGTQADHTCVNAPTGSYCSRTCNVDADCVSGFVCSVPPWTSGKTDTLCIHDAQHIGK